ncbi:multiprotein-bridging factor 1 family protein [Enterococcus rotai]|uniref:multiprotein-bridging factor 1 family protein n=1 Tax=Enterococcus rotai TaxID=118060 RepID=UPI0035C72629
MKAGLTQVDLAKAIGEHTSVVVDIENGSGKYVAGIINQIEKVLKCQIPRGRKKNKKKK